MATSRTAPAAKSTINLRRRGALAVAATAVVATATLSATATAYAKHGDDSTKKDVRNSVACGTGTLKFKAKTDDNNSYELEAELNGTEVGKEWTVTLTDGGKAVWTGKRTTAGLSPSLHVESRMAADGTVTTVGDVAATDTPSTTSTTSPSETTTTTGVPETTTTTTSSTTSTTTTSAPATTTSTSATASPTTDDKGGKKGDDHPSLRVASSKGGDDKGGDDKGGKGDDKGGKGGDSKPGAGSRTFGVTVARDAISCAIDVKL